MWFRLTRLLESPSAHSRPLSHQDPGSGHSAVSELHLENKVAQRKEGAALDPRMPLSTGTQAEPLSPYPQAAP